MVHLQAHYGKNNSTGINGGNGILLACTIPLASEILFLKQLQVGWVLEEVVRTSALDLETAACSCK